MTLLPIKIALWHIIHTWGTALHIHILKVHLKRLVLLIIQICIISLIVDIHLALLTVLDLIGLNMSEHLWIDISID